MSFALFTINQGEGASIYYLIDQAQRVIKGAGIASPIYLNAWKVLVIPNKNE